MSQGKRGAALENAIEQTNAIYKRRGWALIDKVPTPWVVHYNKQSKKVQNAFPGKKSTVDFIGISQGRSIAFDTKNTNNKTSFPLSNVEEHQVAYLLNHLDQGGISFFIISFGILGKVFYVPINDFNEWWVSAKDGGRKSIPYEWFNVHCDVIEPGNGVTLDYIKCCNTLQKKVN